MSQPPLNRRPRQKTASLFSRSPERFTFSTWFVAHANQALAQRLQQVAQRMGISPAQVLKLMSQEMVAEQSSTLSHVVAQPSAPKVVAPALTHTLSGIPESDIQRINGWTFFTVSDPNDGKENYTLSPRGELLKWHPGGMNEVFVQKGTLYVSPSSGTFHGANESLLTSSTENFEGSLRKRADLQKAGFVEREPNEWVKDDTHVLVDKKGRIEAVAMQTRFLRREFPGRYHTVEYLPHPEWGKILVLRADHGATVRRWGNDGWGFLKSDTSTKFTSPATDPRNADSVVAIENANIRFNQENAPAFSSLTLPTSTQSTPPSELPARQTDGKVGSAVLPPGMRRPPWASTPYLSVFQSAEEMNRAVLSFVAGGLNSEQLILRSEFYNPDTGRKAYLLSLIPGRAKSVSSEYIDPALKDILSLDGQGGWQLQNLGVDHNHPDVPLGTERHPEWRNVPSGFVAEGNFLGNLSPLGSTGDVAWLLDAYASGKISEKASMSVWSVDAQGQVNRYSMGLRPGVNAAKITRLIELTKKQVWSQSFYERSNQTVMALLEQSLWVARTRYATDGTVLEQRPVSVLELNHLSEPTRTSSRSTTGEPTPDGSDEAQTPADENVTNRSAADPPPRSPTTPNPDPNAELVFVKPGANLAGRNLSGQSLSGRNMQDANLKNANLEGANLVGANLAGANLSGARLKDADFTMTNLEGATITGQVGSLNGANLRNADMRGVTSIDFDALNEVNLTGANLAGVPLHAGNLREAGFYRHTLADSFVLPLLQQMQSATNLSQVREILATNPGLYLDRRTNGAMRQVVGKLGPSGLDLSFIDLSGLNLAGKDFSGSNLLNTNFTNTNLTGVSFVGSKNLYAATLDGADLTGATGMNYDDGRFRWIHRYPGRTRLADSMVLPVLEALQKNPTQIGKIWRENPNSVVDERVFAEILEILQAGHSGLDLRNLDLSDFDLSDINVPGADFSETILHSTSITRSNLQGANLSQVKLSRRESNSFKESDLRGANLSGIVVPYKGGSYAGLIFRDADLRGANLANSAMTDDERCEGAKVDQHTNLLNATNPQGQKLSTRKMTIVGGQPITSHYDLRLLVENATGGGLWKWLNQPIFPPGQKTPPPSEPGG